MSDATRPVGKPPEYRPDFPQKLLEYFDVEPYISITKKIITKNGDVLEVEEERANDMPTLAGFAVKLGFDRSTIWRWSKEYPEFCNAYKRAIDFQENFLVINGLKGLITPAFAIFAAKNILKWRDRQPDEDPESNRQKIVIDTEDLGL